MPRSRYEIRLAPSAESDLIFLSKEEIGNLKRVVEGIAEMVDLSPIEMPSWLKRIATTAPLIRTRVGCLELALEISPIDRFVRVCGARKVKAQPSSAPAPAEAVSGWHQAA